MKKILSILCLVLLFVSCKDETTQPEFPITLYPTGRVKDTKIRLFVKDGEIFDQTIIDRFLGEHNRFFETPISFSDEYPIMFLSEKEAVWGREKKPVLTVIQEQNLFKLYWEVKQQPLPAGSVIWLNQDDFVHSSGIMYNPSPSENFYDNSKSSQIRKHGTIFIEEDHFLLPQVIAKGRYDHLQVSYLVYKVSSYSRKGSEIVRAEVNTLRISNELQDMSKLVFQPDYMWGDDKIQVSDTIAVKEFFVEYKPK